MEFDVGNRTVDKITGVTSLSDLAVLIDIERFITGCLVPNWNAVGMSEVRYT